MQHGGTITNIYSKQLEPSLKLLKNPTWMRLVIDNPIQDYLDAYKMISQYCRVVVQLADSSILAKLSDADFLFRMQWVKANFPTTVTIETSNESNDTDWTGLDAWERTVLASNFFAEYDQMITLYWQPGCVDFWDANKLPFGNVGLSFYPTQLSDFDLVPGILKQLNSTSLNECGMEQWNASYFGKIKWTEQVMQAAKNLGCSVSWWDAMQDWELWREVFDT